MMSETIEQTIELKSSEEIRSQIGEAAAEVAALEMEQRDVTAKLADPASVFDAQLIVRLRQRADELPLYINSARLKHACLRVEMYDTQSLEHKSRMPELHAAMMEEKTRFEDASAVFQRARAAWQGAHADSRVSSMDANESRALVRQLQSEASNIGGAVVKRRPQAA